MPDAAQFALIVEPRKVVATAEKSALEWSREIRQEEQGDQVNAYEGLDARYEANQSTRVEEASSENRVPSAAQFA